MREVMEACFARSVSRTGAIFMKHVISSFAVFALLSILPPWWALAGPERPVVVVECLKRPPYRRTVEKFVEHCKGDVVRLYVAGMDGADVMELVDEYDPHLILAVGWDALASVKKVEKKPVLHVHTLHAEELVGDKKNVAGVRAIVSPERQFSMLISTIPDLECVGLLYSSKTSRMAKEARMAAARAGVKLIALEVEKRNYIALLLEEMREEIDVFWLLPDTHLLTDEVVGYIFLYSFKNRKPIFAVADKYVEMGAFMAVDVDAEDIGVQAAEMANRILAGEDVGGFRRTEPGKIVISINNNTAREFGIEYDEEILKKVDVLH